MEQIISYRRYYERFKVEGSATLIADKNSEIPSILTDLSSHGAGIFSIDPLKVNEKIQVTIKAPFFFATPLHKEARVAWCNRIDDDSYQAGLDFGTDKPIQFA